MDRERLTVRSMPRAVSAGEIAGVRRHYRRTMASHRRMGEQFIVSRSTAVLGRDEGLMNEKNMRSVIRHAMNGLRSHFRVTLLKPPSLSKDSTKPQAAS